MCLVVVDTRRGPIGGASPSPWWLPVEFAKVVFNVCKPRRQWPPLSSLLSTIHSLGGVSRRADLGHRMISTLCRRLLPSPLGSDLKRLYSMDMVEKYRALHQKRVSHTLSAKTVDQTLDYGVLGYMATAVAQFWCKARYYRNKVASIHLSNSAGNHGASCWRQCLPPPPNILGGHLLLGTQFRKDRVKKGTRSRL